MATRKTEFDIISMGETMMAFEALDYGPLRENWIFRKWIGGAENNFLIGLSRLGFRCGWISRLGDDEFGKEILRTVRGEGIDVSTVVFDDYFPTGVFFVERHSEDDFRCHYYRSNSAATHLSAADIDSDYVSGAKILFLTGITPAISDSALEAVEKVLNIAAENNQVTIFDPNLRLKLWTIDRARNVLIPLMQKSTWVLPGETELRQLMDCDDLAAAIDKAHKLGLPNLIIKTGSQGAVAAIENEPTTPIAGVALKNPISSMGAGDCFAAGFVAGLLKNQSTAECIRWANAMAAFSLRGWGPYQTLPDYDELQRFLRGQAPISR